MKPTSAALSIFLLAALVCACGSTPEPREEATPFRYRHTFEFIWDQVAAELGESWNVVEADLEARELKTSWDVQLAPLNTFGRRDRLIVRVEGDVESGFVVKAFQETERNTSQEDPLSRAEADWDPVESDGHRAQAFLLRFHRRLNPPRLWQEREVR